MKDSLTGIQYGTNENLFPEATYYTTKTKTPFDVSNFFGGGIFMKFKEKVLDM